MRPFVLRRMKADVEKSVPPKEETVVHVELTAVQKQWCSVRSTHTRHTHTLVHTHTNTLITPSSLHYRYRAIYERNVAFLTRRAARRRPR